MRIDIKGPIIGSSQQWIYNWFGIEAFSPKKLTDAIKGAEKNEKLEVYINSGGGLVFSGSEIYTELRNYDGEVEINIVGVAASAASVIAMAGNKIMMSPTAQIMIHNSSSIAWGDKNEMLHTGGVLSSIDESIANAYIAKTGRSKEEIMELMNQETWFNSTRAYEEKFVDGIMFQEPTNKIKNSMELNADGTLPDEVIDKIVNTMKLNEDGSVVARGKVENFSGVKVLTKEEKKARYNNFINKI